MTTGRILVLLCCSGLAAPITTSLATTTLTAQAVGPGPFTCSLPVDRAASGSGLAQPTTARVGGQSGYDRIVFEYAGTALPSLIVTSVAPPFVLDPSGLPLTVSGKVFLGIVFHSLPGIASGYSGPKGFKAGLPVLTDLELSGDFEGVQHWVAGLSGQACVRVFTLTGPSRLVLDLESSPWPVLPNTGRGPQR